MWRVEPLTSADELEAVMAIEHASFSNPWTHDMYAAELENEGVSFFYVARDSTGTIAGFCSLWRLVDELHINNLAVRPDLRRQGVASALLSRVFADGAQLGAQRATLEVRRSNVAALQLYQRFGFTVAGVRRGYYTQPEEDALILWREPGPDTDFPPT